MFQGPEHSALHRLFGPATARVLAAWGHGAVPFRVADEWRELITPADVERWVNAGTLRPPYLKLMRDGDDVPVAAYTGPRTVARTVQHGYVRPDAVAEHLATGASMVLYSIDDWYVPARMLCDGLRVATRCCAQLVGFVTPPGCRAAVRHADDADVVALQLDGEKTWELWEVGADDGSGPGDPDRAEVVTLRPGDGLYVPMRMPHRCVAGGSGSLHLTVTLRPPRLHTALLLALGRAQAATGVQGFLPADPARRADELAGVLDRLGATIRSLDVDALLRDLERESGCVPVPWLAVEVGPPAGVGVPAEVGAPAEAGRAGS
jgi:hypothetical protein